MENYDSNDIEVVDATPTPTAEITTQEILMNIDNHIQGTNQMLWYMSALFILISLTMYLRWIIRGK